MCRDYNVERWRTLRSWCAMSKIYIVGTSVSGKAMLMNLREKNEFKIY